jgi:hypothetical protein
MPVGRIRRNITQANKMFNSSGIPRESTTTTSNTVSKEINPLVINNIDRSAYKSWDGDILNYIKYIEERSLVSYESPFTVSLPPDRIDLVALANRKKCEVIDIYQNRGIENIKEEFDLFTIIPFSNRVLHLKKTIESLIESSKKSGLKIGILVVENSYKPEAADIIDNIKGVYYIWIDSMYKFFNKCLSHNIGSYITKSKYLHFHDCDLVVTDNFYSAIENKFKSGESMMQCFCKRRVNYVTKEVSVEFFTGDKTINDIISNKGYSPGNTGAPGGSIAISRDLFEKTGGFDAHFFWAYSIEDAFFWKKAGYFTNIATLDDPDIEVYHMWHPKSYGNNHLERFERRIYETLNPSNFSNYTDAAISIYKEIMESIKSIN